MRLAKAQRKSLLRFYANGSTMTYSGSTYRGLEEIADKVESLSYESIEFGNLSSDVQPGPTPGSLFVAVCGYLQMDGSDKFGFAQSFNICPNNQGGYYIHNDIFTTINVLN